MRFAGSAHRGCGVLVALLLLSGLPAAAQGAGEATTPPPLPVLQSGANLTPDLVEPVVPDTYIIGDDDLLDVFVLQMPELSRQIRVNDAGTVRLPMMRRSVVAAGQTSSQLGAHLAQALVAEGIARHPTVQVTVRQVMSHRIVVSGAVKNPVVLQATQPATLLEVLARAGGLNATAGTTVQVTRTAQGHSTTESLPLLEVLRGADGANPVLDGGESVRVVGAQMVYTVGALGKPGAFPVQAGEPLTVLKALSLSQGLAEHADLTHAEIIRSENGATPVRLPVNLKQILHHQHQDVALEAGDIFYVPESGRSKILSTIISDAGQLAVIAIGYNARSVF